MTDELQVLKGKNSSLMLELKEVRRENAELKKGQEKLQVQIGELQAENRELHDTIKNAGLPSPAHIKKRKKVQDESRKD